MTISGFQPASDALMDMWRRTCEEDHNWPFEEDVAREVTRFAIDFIAMYLLNKYACDFGDDVLELSIKDALADREALRGY